jgi:threonine dehydrogenase-like Zn-dependent dehydrogenase
MSPEDVARALHAVRRARTRLADAAAVLGDGPLAAATTAVLLARGVGTVDAAEPDVVFECDGSAASRRRAIELVRPAGLVVLVADDPSPTPMSPNLLVFADKRVLGSRGYDDHELELARDLLAAGRLEPAGVPA